MKERLNLYSDDSFFEVAVQPDTLLIRIDSTLAEMSDTNSVVNMMFFKILEVIESLPSFAGYKNYLHYTLQVYLFDLDDEQVVSNFQSTFLTESALGLFDRHQDFGIVIESNEADALESYNFGPYLGLDDLKKRNMIPSDHSNIPDLIDGRGIVAEFKNNKGVTGIDFSTYQEINRKVMNMQEKFWSKFESWT